MTEEELRAEIQKAAFDYLSGDQKSLGVEGLKKCVIDRIAELCTDARKFEDDFLLTSRREGDKMIVSLQAKNADASNFIDRMKAMQEIQPHQYRCACCHEVFDKGWSDEEAQKELGDNFPTVPVEECDLVCDDCYKKMGFGS